SCTQATAWADRPHAWGVLVAVSVLAFMVFLHLGLLLVCIGAGTLPVDKNQSSSSIAPLSLHAAIISSSAISYFTLSCSSGLRCEPVLYSVRQSPHRRQCERNTMDVPPVDQTPGFSSSPPSPCEVQS